MMLYGTIKTLKSQIQTFLALYETSGKQISLVQWRNCNSCQHIEINALTHPYVLKTCY